MRYIPIMWTKAGTCNWSRLSQNRNCSSKPFPCVEIIKVFTTNLGKLQKRKMRTMPINTPDDDRWTFRKWWIDALNVLFSVEEKLFVLIRFSFEQSFLSSLTFPSFLFSEFDLGSNSTEILPLPLHSIFESDTGSAGPSVGAKRWYCLGIGFLCRLKMEEFCSDKMFCWKFCILSTFSPWSNFLQWSLIFESEKIKS